MAGDPRHRSFCRIGRGGLPRRRPCHQDDHPAPGRNLRAPGAWRTRGSLYWPFRADYGVASLLPHEGLWRPGLYLDRNLGAGVRPVTLSGDDQGHPFAYRTGGWHSFGSRARNHTHGAAVGKAECAGQTCRQPGPRTQQSRFRGPAVSRRRSGGAACLWARAIQFRTALPELCQDGKGPGLGRPGSRRV